MSTSAGHTRVRRDAWLAGELFIGTAICCTPIFALQRIDSSTLGVGIALALVSLVLLEIKWHVKESQEQSRESLSLPQASTDIASPKQTMQNSSFFKISTEVFRAQEIMKSIELRQEELRLRQGMPSNPYYHKAKKKDGDYLSPIYPDWFAQVLRNHGRYGLVNLPRTDNKPKSTDYLILEKGGSESATIYRFVPPKPSFAPRPPRDNSRRTGLTHKKKGA